MIISLFHLFEIKIKKKTLFINLFKNFLFIYIYLFIYLYLSKPNYYLGVSNKYVNVTFSNNRCKFGNVT